MMECRNIDELMMEYLYRELDTSKTDAFKQHVDGCKRCTSELASLQATRQALRALPELEPGPDITSRLLAEASRRTPAVTAVGEGEEKGFLAWIAAWLRPVMLHPGFAAAAALVLIGGVAGFLTLKNAVNTKTARIESKHGAESAADERAAAQPLERGMLRAEPASPGAPPMANAPAARGGETGDNGPARDVADQSGYVGNEDVKRGRAATPEEEQRLNEVRGSTRKNDQAEGDGFGGAPGGKQYESSPGPAVDPSEPSPEATNGAADVGEDAKETTTKQTANEPAREPAKKTPAAPPADKAPAKPVQNDKGGGGAGRDQDKLGAIGAAESVDDEAELDGDMVRPAPQPTSVQNRSDSRDGGDSAGADRAQAKEKVKKESKKDDPKVLLGQARAKANTGNCAKANEIKKRLSRSDPEFYRQKVANDADLMKCDPSRTKKRPANKAAEPSMERAPAQDSNTSTGK